MLLPNFMTQTNAGCQITMSDEDTSILLKKNMEKMCYSQYLWLDDLMSENWNTELEDVYYELGFFASESKYFT